MTFLFRWRHKDGSTVEFSDQGWRSDDPEKNDWLIKMNELCASYPVVSPAIRIWLRETCQIVEFSGQEDTATPNRVSQDSGVELDELEAFARAVDAGIPANLSNGSRLFARSKRKSRISIRSISLACDDFFRSRGISPKESFNGWRKSTRPTVRTSGKMQSPEKVESAPLTKRRLKTAVDPADHSGGDPSKKCEATVRYASEIAGRSNCDRRVPENEEQSHL